MDAAPISGVKFYSIRFVWVITALIVVSLLAVGSTYSYRSLTGSAAPANVSGESTALVETITSFGMDPRAAVLLVIGIESISGLISVTLGVLLFMRLLSLQRSYDRMAMFTSFMLLTYGLLITNVTDVITEEIEPWCLLLVAVGFLASVLFFLFILIFPDGRYNPRWTVLIPWATLAWMISWFFFPRLNPDNWPLFYLNLSVVGLIVLAGSVQVYRYLRVYTPIQRQQTKWVALVLVVMIVLGAIQTLVLGEESYVTGTGGIWGLVFVLEQIAFNLTEVIFPATLFLVIRRHRLWDVDRLINKALVYSVVTVLLVGVYFAVVAALQGVFRSLIGQESPLAVAASTLTIAAVFNPARLRVQSFVDRRFYRKQYNAGQALNEFGDLLWQETDLETLSVRLSEVVQNTLQPEAVSIWLAPVPTGSVSAG